MLNDQFYFALEHGNLEHIQSLINDGADVNHVNRYSGMTPLHFAAMTNLLEIAELLLVNHADVDATTRDDATPLHFAVQKGHFKMVKLLLVHHANIDAKTKYEMTPLHLAAQKGYFKIAELLITNHANVNVFDQDGLSPLYYAEKSNRQDIIQLLIDNGANDINDINKHLHDAVSEGDLEAAESAIRDGANVNIRLQDGEVLLFLVIKKGDVDMAKLLIKHKAKIDIFDDDGYTPLDRTIIYNQSLIAKDLIANGADINIKLKNGQVPLHTAAIFGNVEIAGLLIENGADIYDKNNYGQTPLDAAIKYDQGEIVNLFVEKYNDIINTKDEDRNTLLHIAVKNKYGQTPLGAATKDDQEEIMNLFIEKYNNVINTKDKDGNTLLHIAAKNGSSAVVRVLVRNKAELIHIINGNDKTPLFVACDAYLSRHGGGELDNALLDVMNYLIGNGAKNSDLSERCEQARKVLKAKEKEMFNECTVEFLGKEDKEYQEVLKSYSNKKIEIIKKTSDLTQNSLKDFVDAKLTNDEMEILTNSKINELSDLMGKVTEKMFKSIDHKIRNITPAAISAISRTGLINSEIKYVANLHLPLKESEESEKSEEVKKSEAFANLKELIERYNNPECSICSGQDDLRACEKCKNLICESCFIRLLHNNRDRTVCPQCASCRYTKDLKVVK